jgi:hypothetical protein
MRSKFAYLGFIVLLLPLLWIIDDIPYTLDVTAKIYPAKKWVLLKDTDGSLTSTLYNYKDGIINNVRSYKLDNGDVAHIELIPKSTSNIYLEKGDTVAILHSALIDERIELVKSQLEELHAFSKVEQTGLKTADIERAVEQLTFAKQQLEQETQNYARARTLYTEGAIAQAEYHLAEAAYKQAHTQVKIASKAAESAQTGAKPEQIRYNLSKIETGQKELNAIMRQKESYTLLAPIAGKADFNVTPEEVLSIHDTAAYILHFPVKLSDKVYLTSLSKIKVVYPIGAEPLEGSLSDISDKVEYMAGEQLVFAKASLPYKTADMYAGMFLRCRVECDRVNLAEYLRRLLMQSMR